MDLTLKCNVCLTESSDLVKAWETDANNVKWSFKLNSCVPEVVNNIFIYMAFFIECFTGMGRSLRTMPTVH